MRVKRSATILFDGLPEALSIGQANGRAVAFQGLTGVREESIRQNTRSWPRVERSTIPIFLPKYHAVRLVRYGLALCRLIPTTGGIPFGMKLGSYLYSGYIGIQRNKRIL